MDVEKQINLNGSANNEYEKILQIEMLNKFAFTFLGSSPPLLRRKEYFDISFPRLIEVIELKI